MKSKNSLKTKALAVVIVAGAILAGGTTAAAAVHVTDGGCGFYFNTPGDQTTLRMTNWCNPFQFRAKHRFYRNDNTTTITTRLGNYVYATNAISGAIGGPGTFLHSSSYDKLAR